MDGLTYSISEGLVADGNVPSVAEVSVVRHELGHTDFVIEISNLRPGFTLPVRLETIPSQCFPYAVSSPLGFELPHNMSISNRSSMWQTLICIILLEAPSIFRKSKSFDAIAKMK